MKICRSCSTEKVLTDFCKNRTKPGGYDSQCKSCKKEQSAINYAKSPAALAEKAKRDAKLSDQKRGVKFCTKCNTEKSRDEFSVLKKGLDGLSVYCRACTSAYYVNNAEAIKKRVKEYSQQNDVQLKKASAEYRAKNIDIHRKRARDWGKNNPAKAIARAKRYKCRKRNAVPAWSDAKKILEYYETANGLSMLLGEWYHVDHVVPLQSQLVCGLHCEANLQILLGKDNLSKSNRHWPDMP